MDSILFRQAFFKFSAGLLIVGLLLFLPAGTFAYWQAWLLIGILFIPMFIAGFVLMKKSPDLLRRRLNVKEEQAEQKEVIFLSGLMFLAAFIVAGLNCRFRWLVPPAWVSFVSAVVFLIAYALYAEVLRENAYLFRSVEVQENQKVIDTGLYGIVRHPMYMSTLLLFLSMPLVLGSVFSGLLECFQTAYYGDKPIITDDLTMKTAVDSDLPLLSETYDLVSAGELKRIVERKKVMLGYDHGRLIGFVGEHLEGSMGLLYVFPRFRRKGYGAALEKSMIAKTLEEGYIPFGQVEKNNHASMQLQKKIGMTTSEQLICWMWK